MKVSRIWALLVALVLLYISNGGSNSTYYYMVFAHHGDSMLITKPGRKLKEGNDNLYGDKHNNADKFELDDYSPADPVPWSKTTIVPGPIEHGTPVIPYIPKPPSPSPPPSQPSGYRTPTQAGGSIDP